MATKNQLYAIALIKKILNIKFQGNLNEYKEVSEFISKYYSKAKKEEKELDDYYESENLYRSVTNPND